jgi:N-acetylneuraminic acid mutarotase
MKYLLVRRRDAGTSFKIITLLFSAPFFFAGAFLFAQDLVWKEGAQIFLARAGYMSGVIDHKYVIAGGSYWKDGKKYWTDEVDIFNPVRNVWTKAAALPEPRSDAANVGFENALYVFGGGANGSVRRDALVFRKGKWSALPEAELPEPRLYSVAIACMGTIYLLGGLSNAGDYTTLSNAMWMWNPHQPKAGWKVLDPLPGPGLITHAMAELNGKVYVLGGAKTGGADVINVDTAYEFDPHVQKWTKLPDLPIERRCWWGVPIDDKVLLFGGNTQTYESDVFAYTPATAALTHFGQMPHGLCDAKFFQIDSSIIGVGGEAASGVRGPWTLELQLTGREKRGHHDE